MRIGVGDDAEMQAALAAAGLRSAILFWLEFASGGVGLWTGSHTLTVSADPDPLISGKTFEPIAEGILLDISNNQFTYNGSEALTVTVAIPDVPSEAMINARADSAEYQGRMAYIWRSMMVTPPTETTAAVWAFKRTRAGAMDELSITDTGRDHTFSLSIEGHASMISNATGSTYLDQKKFDPTDTSQDFAVSIANTPGTPKRSATGGGGGGRGGGGGDGGGTNFDGIYGNQFER